MALVRIELTANSQEHIAHHFTRPRFRLERLPAVAASGRNVGLLHVYIVELKVAINCNHARPHESAELRDPSR